MSRLIDADALIPMMKYATTDNDIGIFPIRIGFDEIVKVIEEQPTIEPEPHWTTIKYRHMDAEERAYWEDHFGYDISEEDAVLFDCKMPDDGQEILVSYRKWVCMDKCEIDGGCYGLEGNGDWDGVIAWMPLPEPWEGDEK